MTNATSSASRWRLRFSLRTLLLLVLLIASAAVAWWNWEPWYIDYVIQEPSVIYQVQFSGDGRFICTVAKAPGATVDTKNGFEKVVTMRDAGTGAVRGTWRFERAMGNVTFQDPRYIQAYVNTGKEPHSVYVNVDTGDRVDKLADASPPKFKDYSHDRKWKVDFEDIYSHPGLEHNQMILTSVESGAQRRINLTDNAMPTGRTVFFFTPKDDRLVVTFDSSTFVFEFPSVKLLATHAGELWNERNWTRDGEYLILDSAGANPFTLAKRDDPTKSTVISAMFYGISPDEKRILGKNDSNKLYAWDVGTGKQLWEHEGGEGFSPGYEYFFSIDPSWKSVAIRDGRTGNVLFEPKSWMAEKGLLAPGKNRTFGQSGQFVTTAYDYYQSEMYYYVSEMNGDTSLDKSKFKDESEEWKRAVVWSRRGLLGFAKMPEVWATILLACALLWSLWRDSKSFGRSTTPTPASPPASPSLSPPPPTLFPR